MDKALKEINPKFKWAFFENGDELLNFVKESNVRPPLIITDIYMHRKNGIEILKAIRDNQHLCNTPLMIFTNSSSSLDIELTSLCDGYYVKGEDYEGLKNALSDMLSFLIKTGPDRSVI